ncbi:MAG: glycine/betaine/sarcosine/D-proline family reductase selenoprotein B [Nitrospinota bacterium]|nr:glycine/betaine/sarcosine/D-proline family reductase selenoprotein B [Nitrospinota bacterium]
MQLARVKNRLIAKLFTRFPSLARGAAAKVPPLSFDQTPWAPFDKPLAEARIALLTTGGIHLRSDTPFDMTDSTGDPVMRVVPSATPVTEMMITHDYYDHTDADSDINIVFPVERLREMVAEGVIGGVTERFFSFMGHIDQNHFPRFLEDQLPKVAAMLKEDGADAVLITPG